MIELALNMIERKIQDASYSQEDFIDLINVCIGEIASTEALPYLVRHDEVTVLADSFEVALPGDYYSGLLRVQNLVSGKEVRLYRLSEFLEIFKDLTVTGEVANAALAGGNNLLVQFVPTEDTELRLWYSAHPDIVEDEDSVVECIPRHLQIPLFVNYVCSQIYGEIEDGADGRDINTQKYTAKYYQARADLQRHLGVADGVPSFVMGALRGFTTFATGDITDEV
jgi:hypothetical protein